MKVKPHHKFLFKRKNVIEKSKYSYGIVNYKKIIDAIEVMETHFLQYFCEISDSVYSLTGKVDSR